MWARGPGPMRFETDHEVGVRLQLSSSDQISGATGTRHFHNHRSGGSSGAAGDTESESQLQNFQTLQQPQQVAPLKLPLPGTEDVANILDRMNRMNALLAHNQQPTYSFLDSSETEDGGSTALGTAVASDAAKAHGSRPVFNLRTSVFHGHAAARRSGSGAGTARSQSAIETRPRHQQPQPSALPSAQTPLQPAADGKSAASSRSRYFFESKFIKNLPVSCAREEIHFAENETTERLDAIPGEDAAAQTTVQPSTTILMLRYADSAQPRPAPSSLRNLRAHENWLRPSVAVSCQTDSIEFRQHPPLPQPPPRSKSRCRSARRSRQARRQRPSLYSGYSGDRVEDVEQEGSDAEQRHRRLRRFRAEGVRSPDNERPSSLLRSVGRHLNYFFCPGSSACGRCADQAASQALVVSLETPDILTAGVCEPRPRCHPETARRLTEPPSPAHRVAATARAWCLQTAEIRTGGSLSHNSSLETSSSDWRTPTRSVERRKRRKEPVDSFESSISLCPADSWGTEDGMCGDGSGFDSLMRTIDRARQRLGATRSTRTTERSSPTSHHSVVTGYHRDLAQQPQQLKQSRDHCHLHICEVACEVDAPNEAQDEVDEEQGNWPDGNQSNAGCHHGCGCVRQIDEEDDDACLIASVELVPGDSLLSTDDYVCWRDSQHLALVGSVQQCLQTMAQDMQSFVHRIHGTVAELQRLREST